MTHKNREKGTILFLVALLGMTLMAFMALAFDGSYSYYLKRRLQTAADAAAIAGAQELLRSATAQVTTAARNDSSLNRYTHGANNVDVTVHNPPVSGSKVGDPNFVEVIVSKPRPNWFLGAFGGSSSTVRARAVSGLVESGSCIFALNRDSSQTNNGFFVNGTTELSVGCSIISNANFRTVGGGCVITPGVSYTGTYSNGSSADANCGPDSPGHGIPAVDPVASRFSLPATSPCAFTNYKETAGTTVVVSPGIYCGGIELTGNVGSVTFEPGTYVLVGGGLKIGSGVNASGAGVTFFNTFPGTNSNQYDPVLITTTGTVSFTAPTSGSNKALLFYQDPRVSWRSNNGSVLTSGAGGTYQGIVYFPSTDLTYSGSSSTSYSGNDGYTILVGYNVKVAGNARVNADFSSLGGSNPLQSAAFVE
jgi:hypothetical protein